MYVGTACIRPFICTVGYLWIFDNKETLRYKILAFRDKFICVVHTYYIHIYLHYVVYYIERARKVEIDL